VVLKAMQDAGKPVRPGDVANATGIESKEVSKLIQELKKDVDNLRQNEYLFVNQKSLSSIIEE
jgi:hypothetical protein